MGLCEAERLRRRVALPLCLCQNSTQDVSSLWTVSVFLMLEVRASVQDERLGAANPRLEAYAAKSRSENTLRAYAADLKDFRHWCARFERAWLPAAPETVALYLASRSEELALATQERRLASINAVHKDEGYFRDTCKMST